jgi:transcriptional regulator with XRE-family HTH domain
MSNWGERLRQIRLHEGLTQRRVAKRMNLCQSRVSRIEAQAVLKVETIENYLDAMNNEYVLVFRGLRQQDVRRR